MSDVTTKELANKLDVSERTIQRWRIQIENSLNRSICSKVSYRGSFRLVFPESSIVLLQAWKNKKCIALFIKQYSQS